MLQLRVVLAPSKLEHEVKQGITRRTASERGERRGAELRPKRLAVTYISHRPLLETAAIAKLRREHFDTTVARIADDTVVGGAHHIAIAFQRLDKLAFGKQQRPSHADLGIASACSGEDAVDNGTIRRVVAVEFSRTGIDETVDRHFEPPVLVTTDSDVL